MIYKLAINSKAKTLKQKRGHFVLDRNQTVSEEVQELLDTRFIKEWYCTDWLVNVVIGSKVQLLMEDVYGLDIPQ